MATKPRLSREYIFVPFAQMNFDVADLDISRIAFMDAGVEPTDPDWNNAIIVDSLSPLFVPTIGESIALLVGPTRGEVVTMFDLANGDYQVWVDAAIPTSDERVVRVAGIFTVSTTG